MRAQFFRLIAACNPSIVQQALYLCGGQVRLKGQTPASFWTDDIRPFTTPADYGFSHGLELFLCDDPSAIERSEGAFEYRRHDLTFTSNEHGSKLWYDGGVAAVLAGLELALSQAVRDRGGVLLHASAGVVGSHCWVMPGPSGSGKSTVARGGFDLVLSDERVAIIPDEDGYRVWSTPFWSDGRSLSLSTGSAPLTVLAFLRKATAPNLGTIDRGTMVAWFLRSLVLYETSETAQIEAFNIACQIVDSARIVTLDFPKEGTWIPSLIKRTGLTF